jgi:hypothetical protein
LKLSGVVKRQPDHTLHVRNRIYEQVFSDAWVRKELPVDRRWRVAIALILAVLLLGFGLWYRYALTSPSTDSQPRTSADWVPTDLLPVHRARVERSTDGLVHVFVETKTPTVGWRIYTNYEVSGTVMDVRLRGELTSSNATRAHSHPFEPTIIVPDRNVVLRGVTIYGSNGTLLIPMGTQPGAYVGRLTPYPAPSGKAPNQ